MSQGTSQTVATFRDPAGSLHLNGDQVLRTVHPLHAAECLRFLQSDLARRWTDQGHLVASQVLSAEADQALLLEHPRVFFPRIPGNGRPGSGSQLPNLRSSYVTSYCMKAGSLKTRPR